MMASFEAQLEAARLTAVAKAEEVFADPAELSAFMTARLDEDEAAAVAARDKRIGSYATVGDADWRATTSGDGVYTVPHGMDVVIGKFDFLDDETAIHIARHDPARVLAEVAVKRERLRMYVQQRETLRDVYASPDKYTFDQQLAVATAASVHEVLVRMDATVHDQHPDFKVEWRLP